MWSPRYFVIVKIFIIIYSHLHIVRLWGLSLANLHVIWVVLNFHMQENSHKKFEIECSNDVILGKIEMNTQHTLPIYHFDYHKMR
jgi:hypothetical protein